LEEKGAVMEKWLECTITLGQFSGEYAVQGEMFDATDFSLFAPKKDLIFHEEPATGKPVKGLIRIVPGAQKEDLVMVSLPRPTFENGRTITINKNQIREAD
jgi:hypothetical protein